MTTPFSLAYTFTVSGFPADTFTVQQFRAINWKLNEDYEWEVSVLSQQLLAADSLITQAATVMLQAFHTTEYYHSVIGFIHHTRHPDATGHYRYTFTLRSPLHPLQHSAHNWVYREQSVLDMAKTVLSRLPTPLTLDDNDVTKSYPTRDMVIQYHESDYAFLQRLLSEAGIGFALWQEETGVTLRLFDNHLANFPDADAPLPYIPSGNQVPSDASVSYVNAFYTAMVPQTVQLYTYQYETPEAERHVSVTSTHPLASHGTWEYRRQSYRDLTDGQALATLRVQAFDVQRHHIRADTDDMSLQPGMRVTLTGHAESQYTGDFHIISMEVGGCQPPEPGQPRDASLFITTPYANTLTLLPVATPYVPPYIEAPRHTESVIAWVDSPESDATYPYLDEWGRYKLRFPFDEANHPKGDASGWVRALQPFGGKGKGPMGAHFAYRPGTEVVVKGMDGDINEPVILGALNNAESPSVHKTRHAKQQLLYTWGGNEAMLNDDPDQTEARLSTKGRDNRLYFYDAADDDDGTQPGKRHQQAELVSENGIVTLACDALFHASAGDSATHIAGASHISTTHGHHTETTRQGQVQRSSGAGMTQTASRHVVNKTHDHSITFKTPQDITVNATQHIGIHSVKGNISLTAPRDSVHIQHGQVFHAVGTGTGPVTMKGGKSSMQFTKDGEAIIQAPKIIIEADDIHFHGNVVYNNGTAASGMTTTGVGTDVTEKKDAPPVQQQTAAAIPAAAQAGAVSATPNSDTDLTTSTKHSLSSLYPDISVDLNKMPEIYLMPIVTRNAVYTIRIKMLGKLKEKKRGVNAEMEINKNSYTAEAKAQLGNFVGSFNLMYKDDKKVCIGSEVAGKYWAVRVEMSEPALVYEVKPEPIDAEYNGWDISGEFGYELKITVLPKKDQPGMIADDLHSISVLSKFWLQYEVKAFEGGLALLGASLSKATLTNPELYALEMIG